MQHEVLLREIVEYIPATTYAALSAGLVVMSEMAFAIPSVAYPLAGMFSLRAVVLYRRGRKVKKYQKNLTRLQMYRMSTKDIPISHKVHFLGMGFPWIDLHAQRAYDINQSYNRKYREYPASYRFVRNLELKLESKRWAKWLVNWTSSARHDDKPKKLLGIPLWRLNPWEPAPPLEGYPWLHAIGLYEPEQKLLQNLGNRVGHTLVLGTTRVGKTRLAELIITQDIARGDVVIVIDPKGDGDLLLRCYSEAVRAGREDQFYFFHLGYPEISAQYNPVGSFIRLTEVATRIASQMPGEGQAAAFKEFVWGYVNQITKGLVGVGKTPTYPLIKQYSQDLDPLYIEFMDKLLGSKIGNYQELLQTYLAKLMLPKAEERRAAGLVDDISKINRDKKSIARYLIFKHHFDQLVLTAHEQDIALSLTKAFTTDHQYLSKLIASLDPFLEKMTTGTVSQLIAPSFQDPRKPVFDWGSIIQSGGIVYVGLDALTDQEVARTVGSSMLADLTSQYGLIYKEGRHQGLPEIGKQRRDRAIRVHIDEANEPADKNLIPSLNKAGGANVSVTAYTQTSSDLEARLGSKALAQQMFGNFNTVISFRVQDEETARVITVKQRMATVRDLVTFSGSSDSSDVGSKVDFTSSTQSRVVEKERPMISPTDLLQLPKGQFFLMMGGGLLFKGRVPLLTSDRSEGVPSDIRDVAARMDQKYQSEIPNWYTYRDELPAVKIFEGSAHPDKDMEQLRINFRDVWTDDMDMDFALGSNAAMQEAYLDD